MAGYQGRAAGMFLGKASDVKGDADVKEAAGAVEAHDVKEAADSGGNPQ